MIRWAQGAAVAILSGALVMGTSLSAAGAVTHRAASGGATVAMALPAGASINDWFPVESSLDESGTNLQANAIMYTGLVEITPTDTADYADSLAQSVTASKADTVFTIHLHPGLKWSDGTPVTSADVVFTYDLMAASCTKTAPWSFAQCGSDAIPYQIESFKADGPDTVVVTLNKGANPVWFIQNALDAIVPVPKAVWDKYANWNQELKWVGTLSDEPSAPEYKVVDGAFKFQSLLSGQYYAFVPNPEYGFHKATVSRFVWEYFASDEAEFVALRKGTLDVGYLPNSLYSARGQLGSQYGLDPWYDFGFTYLQPNFSPKAAGVGGVFQSLAVRQALQYGVDEKTMIKIVDGQGIVDYGPIPSLPKNPFYDPRLGVPYPYNPAKGKEVLLKAGYKMVKGVMTKGGTPLAFTLVFVSGNTTFTSWATLLKEDWAKEGIDVTLEEQPFTNIISLESQQPAIVHKWAMVWWGGWGYFSYPTGDEVLGTGATAWDGYDDAKMNALIAATEAPGTAVQTNARLDAYQVYAADQVPIVYLPSTPTFWEVSKSLKGFMATMAANGTYYPNDWTVGG
jgi:peptide/nickel transport system substrate-binding protein